MKLFVLSVFLFVRSAIAFEEEIATESSNLGVEEGRASKTFIDIQKPDLNFGEGDPMAQLLLAIGNVMGVFGDIPGLNDILVQLEAAGIEGVPATILASIVALSAGKASFLSMFLKPLQIANQVLAIVGIALLGTYLVESEGDFTGLLRRSDEESADSDYYSYSAYEPQAAEVDTSYYNNRLDGARSLGSAPIIQRLGTFVDKAIETYDKLNA